MQTDLRFQSTISFIFTAKFFLYRIYVNIYSKSAFRETIGISQNMFCMCISLSLSLSSPPHIAYFVSLSDEARDNFLIPSTLLKNSDGYVMHHAVYGTSSRRAYHATFCPFYELATQTFQARRGRIHVYGVTSGQRIERARNGLSLGIYCSLLRIAFTHWFPFSVMEQE